MSETADHVGSSRLDAPSTQRPTRYVSLLVGPTLTFIVTWGPLFVVSCAIFWFSNQPGLGKPNLVEAWLMSLFDGYPWYVHVRSGVAALDAATSWLAHFVEYALLSLTCLWAFTGQWPRLARPLLLAIVYAALFALCDEFHQSFVPGRHSDVRDVLTDWAGAAIAVVAATLYQRSRFEK